MCYNFIMSDKIFKPEQAPIGFQIGTLRKERGWSLAELARRAGTSAPSLHRYENGWDRFELATLRRLAAALEVRLNVSLEAVRRDEPESTPSNAELARLLKPLFWDRPLEPKDIEQYPLWVLRRVLMFGDRQQVEASRRFYGDDAVSLAATHRETDARTRNYWNIILGSMADEPQSPQS
jgi:transcriptional regulator with XRE-family HTH domain